jgi:hypothetical protein
MPKERWLTNIPEHHEAYISWEEFLENNKLLEHNRTNMQEVLSSGPASEGFALLQRLLICAACGRRLTVRYKSNGGISPSYECSWRRRDGITTPDCVTMRSEPLDAAIGKRVMEVIASAEIKVALEGHGRTGKARAKPVQKMADAHSNQNLNTRPTSRKGDTWRWTRQTGW